MISRRSLLGMVPAVPVIGFFDWDRMPDDPVFRMFTPESRALGYDDLIKMPPAGPYMKFVWLHQEDDERMPSVRGMLWAREESDKDMSVGVETHDGYRNYRVLTHPAIDDLKVSWQPGMAWSHYEALHRLVWSLNYQDHGLTVTYKDAP